MSFQLSQKQGEFVSSVTGWYRAVENGSASPVYRGAGLAGTGKSTILPFILDDLGIPRDSVLAMAPTGKAAKVMTTKFKDQGLGLLAKTIHSTIYTPNGTALDSIEAQITQYEAQLEQAAHRADREKVELFQKRLKVLSRDFDRQVEKGDELNFSMKAENAVMENARLIILDESSMIDTDMAADLMSFGVPILAIGDPGQLPPINGEQWFTEANADFFLTEIHRQAADNPIIRLAHDARHGKMPKVGDYGHGVRVLDRKDDDVTYNTDRDITIICGSNNKRFYITRKLRAKMGLSPFDGPYDGEPLLISKNSKKRPDLVNGLEVLSGADHSEFQRGMPSTIIRIESEGTKTDIKCVQSIFEQHWLGKGKYSCGRYDLMNAYRSCEFVDFGHAITCHKSQGSQWPEVVVHDESSMFGEDRNRWAYTAFTRAAERLTIIV